MILKEIILIILYYYLYKNTKKKNAFIENKKIKINEVLSQMCFLVFNKINKK